MDQGRPEQRKHREDGAEMEGNKLQVERVPLSRIKPGQSVKLISIDGGCTLQSRLASLGLIPGARIEVVRNNTNGPFVVAVKGSRLVLGRGMAQQILVS